MAQTNPNRRYLFAGTSLGLINDTLPTELPPNGTIFDTLNKYGISWKDYYSDNPSPLVFLGLTRESNIGEKFVKMEEFFKDADAGTLPQFSLLDPNYAVQSEENPQDIQFGDQYLAGVVNAVMHGPQWSQTLMIWTYDESGGWYDHVPPPAAIAPDDVPPDLPAGFLPGGFDLYGFRVPAGRHLPLREARLRLPRGLRPHVGPEDGGDEVEPPRSHAARRQRHRRPRHGRPEGQAGLPHAAEPARPGQPGQFVPCLATGPGPIPPPVGGDGGMRRPPLGAARGRRLVPGAGGMLGLPVGLRTKTSTTASGPPGTTPSAPPCAPASVSAVVDFTKFGGTSSTLAGAVVFTDIVRQPVRPPRRAPGPGSGGRRPADPRLRGARAPRPPGDRRLDPGGALGHGREAASSITFSLTGPAPGLLQLERPVPGMGRPGGRPRSHRHQRQQLDDALFGKVESDQTVYVGPVAAPPPPADTSSPGPGAGRHAPEVLSHLS